MKLTREHQKLLKNFAEAEYDVHYQKSKCLTFNDQIEESDKLLKESIEKLEKQEREQKAMQKEMGNQAIECERL